MANALQYLMQAAEGSKRRIKNALADPIGQLELLANRGVENTRAALQKATGKPYNADYEQAYRDAMNEIALNMMTVYHGSPHKFDKFDMSKIGTGEGAQAYGHGIYMAESPKVAQSYADDGAIKYGDLLRIGKHEIPREDWRFEAAIAAKKAIEEGEGFPRYFTPKQEKWAEAVRGRGLDVEVAEPLLYKVDIPDEAVARMLDWDKPLSEQAPEVQAAIRNYATLSGKEHYIPKGTNSPVFVGEGISGDTRGQDLYNWLGDRQGSASELKAFGIPGIRYLDGGSRAAGEGTSNFVLFDDQLPRILERNGEATGLQPWAPGEANTLLGLPAAPTRPRNALGQEIPPTKYELAHEVAQRNAALPVEQGGLGLPPNNTAMDRARAMGYSAPDYVGSHSAPMSGDSTAPLHDLARIYPDDIYSDLAARYYGHGEDYAQDKAVMRFIQSYKDKPNSLVTMFRAIPKGASKFVHHGDWVTPNKQYAIDHGESALDGKYQIITTRQPAKNFITDANSPYEFGLDKTQSFASGPASLPVMVSKKDLDRSRFAAFDPIKRDSADLLAGVAPYAVALPMGSALLDFYEPQQ